MKNTNYYTGIGRSMVCLWKDEAPRPWVCAILGAEVGGGGVRGHITKGFVSQLEESELILSVKWGLAEVFYQDVF